MNLVSKFYLIWIFLIVGCFNSDPISLKLTKSPQQGSQKQLKVDKSIKAPKVVRSLSEKKAKPKKIPLIVIDAGHGGRDSGAIGLRSGINESKITLRMAKYLKEILEETYKYKVKLTRTKDKYISLGERVNIANKRDADIFLSLHVNSSGFGSVRGIEVYYLDSLLDSSTRKLVLRENELPKNASISIVEMMIGDLIQLTKNNQSIPLAHKIHDTLRRHLSDTEWSRVKLNGVNKAPFYVLVGTHMPSILLELMYIDNKEDFKLLTNPVFLRELTTGIAEGVDKYLKSNK